MTGKHSADVIERSCDYGGCEKPAVSGINHEGEHWFCQYHLDEVSP